MMRLGKFEYSVDQLKNQPEHSLGPSKDGTEEKDTRINVTRLRESEEVD
jgi:hypothetical protein